jgi:hexosaminidase
MRRSIIPWLLLTLACAGCAPRPDVVVSAPVAALPALLPLPAQRVPASGRFTLRDDAAMVVHADDARATVVADMFAQRLADARGLRLGTRAQGRPADVVFALDPADASLDAAEGYRLVVDAAGITLAARSPEGLFRGSTTLWQLLTPQMTRSSAIDVAAVRIVDRPRWRWRGAMLDSARHFQPPAFIKRFIDELALAKLNVLHWHLTDDQGWRIEIRRHPRLTEVGAWRRPAGAAGTDANGQAVRYGGYYTQDEIRDIVAYAADRYVTIVPEIDMPGHMQAAIAAYPQLGSAGDTPVVSPDWGVHGYILNADEPTVAFMQDVLDEVVELFPSRYIHVGGDEAVKDQWKASPHVQQRMRELGIADEAHLQAWFIARMQAHLAAKGRRLIGWDEILEGELPPDATVMSWRGTRGGIEAAAKGHDVVMAPAPDLYLDHLQGSGADEPSGRPDLRTLADVYAFDPTAGVDAAAAKHVLGAQANLWTEHMRTPAMVEHAAFPRLAALAETLWSPASTHDWGSFITRLVPQMERYRARRVAAASSAFEVDIADAANGITLANQAGLPMRYTTDGSEPDAKSLPYREPLAVPGATTLRAATFLDGHRVGDIATRLPDAAAGRASNELGQCSGKLVLRIEDDAPATGPRAFFNVDLFDPCWTWLRAPLDGIGRIRVEVGQVPYNFQLWKDIANIVPRPKPEHAGGELLVHRDGCQGPMLARIALPDARTQPGVAALDAALDPQAGVHDLCFVFSGEGHDPLWAIERVKLVAAPSAAAGTARVSPR